MLVFSRKRDESIVINGNTVVTVVGFVGDKVRLGIQAPIEIPVDRQEVFEAIKQENAERAAQGLPPKVINRRKRKGPR